MDISESAGPDLLPSVPQTARGELDYFFAEDREIFNWWTDMPAEEQKTFYWSTALMAAAPASALLEEIPGAFDVAYGFTGLLVDEDSFGIAVLTDMRTSLSSTELEAVQIAGAAFTVRTVPITRVPHRPSVHPSEGTSGAWARSRASTQKSDPGLLTAHHVVGYSPVGTLVTLTSGAMGVIEDVAPPGFDAAVLSGAGQPSTPLRKLFVQAAAAPWSHIEFVGQSSGRVRGQVCMSTDILGIGSSAVIPVHYYLSVAGRTGDSGALVRNADYPQGVGIYNGAAWDPTGREYGWSTSLHQVTVRMDIEVYE